MRAALKELPAAYAGRLSNIDFTLQRTPSRLQRRGAELRGGTLYGLYEGIPLLHRGEHYGNVTPDRVTIFWGPLVRDFPEDEDLELQVKNTVYHEIAHHFGINDDDLRHTRVE